MRLRRDSIVAQVSDPVLAVVFGQTGPKRRARGSFIRLILQAEGSESMHEVLNGLNPKGDARLLKDLGLDVAPALRALSAADGHGRPGAGSQFQLRLVPAPVAAEPCEEQGPGEGAEGDALAPATGLVLGAP